MTRWALPLENNFMFTGTRRLTHCSEKCECCVSPAHRAGTAEARDLVGAAGCLALSAQGGGGHLPALQYRWLGSVHGLSVVCLPLPPPISLVDRGGASSCPRGGPLARTSPSCDALMYRKESGVGPLSGTELLKCPRSFLSEENHRSTLLLFQGGDLGTSQKGGGGGDGGDWPEGINWKGRETGRLNPLPSHRIKRAHVATAL